MVRLRGHNTSSTIRVLYLFLISVLFVAALSKKTHFQIRPIVLWHGMGDTSLSDQVSVTADAASIIRNVLGVDVYVKSLEIGNNSIEDYENAFLMHPDQQIEIACKQIHDDPALADGYNAIGFSQGGLFLRALAQRCPNPPMLVLITLGSPHQGVYGLPKCSITKFNFACKFIRKILSFAAYKDSLQRDLVPATYWHNPLNEESFRNKSTFLADVNNVQQIRHKEYSKNLKKLKRFVMVKFKKDSVIEPKESQWFEFYTPGQDKEILPLRESDIYLKGELGLKNMDMQGKLKLIEINDEHLTYSREWFIRNIIPFLRT